MFLNHRSLFVGVAGELWVWRRVEAVRFEFFFVFFPVGSSLLLDLHGFMLFYRAAGEAGGSEFRLWCCRVRDLG